MGDGTGISWTDATWNPIRGCSRVSEGCRHCYAEQVAARFSGPGQPYDGLAKKVGGEARWTGEVRFIEEHLADPLRWRKPRRIFVNSMSDLFHEKLTDEQIAQVWGVMRGARRHTFQVLTKRPQRMLDWLSRCANAEKMGWVTHDGTPNVAYGGTGFIVGDEGRWPLPNVHLGVSAEDQDTFDQRVELLGRTPAALRFVSLEPLLGPIDLGNFADEEPDTYDPLYRPVQWVIVGGESGPDHRPMSLDWLRSIVEQCRAAHVPVWVKQDSGPKPGLQGRIPDALWVQESPG